MNSNSPVNGENERMCLICRYQDPPERWVLECKHEFHTKCLDPWARQCNSCPTCKMAIDKSRPVLGCPFSHIEEDYEQAYEIMVDIAGDDFDPKAFMQIVINSLIEQ